jgi:hypothetical protein
LNVAVPLGLTLRGQNCRAKATTIARSVDAGGRPLRQYELCQAHAESVAERERDRGRENRNAGIVEQR